MFVQIKLESDQVAIVAQELRRRDMTLGRDAVMYPLLGDDLR